MEWTGDWTVAGFNAFMLVSLTVVALVMLIVSHRSDWGEKGAYRAAVRAMLPFGTEIVAASVRRRTRTEVRAKMWGAIITLVLAVVVFTVTPLSASPYFLWLVTLMLLVGVLTVTAATVSVHERLFSPTPAAVRVARSRRLATRDYLGGLRRRTPDALLALAVVATVLVALAQSVTAIPTGPAVLTYAGLGFAVLVGIGTRIAEDRVLDQAQPASNTLELAWDDLFRADALSSLRLGAAMAAWLPLGLATAFLATVVLRPHDPDASLIAGLFPWWGLPVLQVVYLAGQGRLPAALYPEFLRAPALAPEGGPA